MAKQTGIWIDKRVAKIITLDGDGGQMMTVESDVEEFNPKGGSRHRNKFGPQDVVQDSKYLERKKHQTKDYFEDVADKLPDSEALVVFGPADTGRNFVEHLEKHNKALQSKVTGVERADSMTDNQLKAWVRKYFTGSEKVKG